LKKYFVTVALLAVIAACNNSGTESETSDSSSTEAPAAPSNDLSSNPDYQKGLALVASNDCLTCHKVDEKVTGPAYREVANKYENTPENVTMLAQKVINGGSGNWGEVAMTPHPALSQADAEQMIKYILLLKNN
jgi:cytochrome c